MCPSGRVVRAVASAQQVTRQAGITYRQLDTWTSRGWLRPWHDGGTGTFREYPTGEVRVAVLMGRLTRAGLTAEAAARAARAVGEDGRAVLGDGLVQAGADAVKRHLAAVLPTHVYIAEVIWFCDNPVDGRTRIAVCQSLDEALAILRGHDIHGGDLVATETTSALGTRQARTWAVHEKGEEPDDMGHLWITEEPIRHLADCLDAKETDHA